MDFDDPIREKAAELGAQIASRGPEALLEQVEEILPEEWREQIRTFPIAAITLGLGVGVFLGMKKSDLVIAAVTSLITAATTQNVSSVLGGSKA
jgi:hypothetical protein